MIEPKNWFDNLGEWLTRTIEEGTKFLMFLAVIVAYGLFFWFAYVVLKSITNYLGNI